MNKETVVGASFKPSSGRRKVMEEISKNLKKRFILKYIALAFLGITMLNGIILIIFRIIEELSNKPGIYTSIFMGAMFFSLIVGIILAIVYQRIYDRNLLIKKLEKNHKAEDISEFIKEYLSIFVNNKMGFIRYSEYVFWFSREIRFLYRQKDFYDKFISGLYRGLRCNEGVNVAGIHKDSFIQLCKEILENPEIDIYNRFCKMENEEKQMGKLVIVTDPIIFCYWLIVIAHILGCLCISGRLQETLGNLLIALPADLLLIYTYVRDRKSKKDKERDKLNEV